MDWKSTASILADSAEVAPSKPTEPSSDGFDGSLSAESPKMPANPDESMTPIDALDNGVKARLHMFRRQFEETAAPAVPAFLFRPGTPYTRGRCFSCGDRLLAARFGQCWRCSLAWRLACQVQVPTDFAGTMETATVSA
jgi:hypothetical protein